MHVADILYGDHAVTEWDKPWDSDKGKDLMQGGHPLKKTGDRWERRAAHSLRFWAAYKGFGYPTWLTTDEIEALDAETIPGAQEVEVEHQGRPAIAYNVSEISGLPEDLYRPFWEIHPIHHDPRHPGFERYVRSLGVEIQHVVNRKNGWTEAQYREIPNKIIMPPFEMFFSARDYYLTLAHELAHWAVASTDLVETTLESEGADYARNELVAEFAAAFLVAEQGLSDDLHPRTVSYVRKWRETGSLTDAQSMHAAEDAARVATWISHEAPAWRAGGGETRRQTPHDSHYSAPPRGLADFPAFEAAAAARRFVADAFALERSIEGKDRDAWVREAGRLLETAKSLDLGIPAVVTAIEAAVVIETSFATPRPSAASWLETFQERTARARTTMEMARNTADMSASTSHGPRF